VHTRCAKNEIKNRCLHKRLLYIINLTEIASARQSVRPLNFTFLMWQIPCRWTSTDWESLLFAFM